RGLLPDTLGSEATEEKRSFCEAVPVSNEREAERRFQKQSNAPKSKVHIQKKIVW
ncbi:hypothetical protein CLOHYLEM_07810, partial [[Clostridium] hylemonae DSM 15053]